MQSFRTELENPIVEKDIIDLEQKIRAFHEGKIHEEKFRSLRLARGVYGQRQAGVQMVRIKLPFGKITFKQILKIADISDEYASSNLHFTTRQDIQIHYVSLDRTPELWAKLEQDDITLREACGNTVRNVTASPTAGIDPTEPFDVSPYAQAFFEYFLRNPICQEMGRKIKIAFSSSDADTAFSFIHDLGFIPKIKLENGKEVRGFKVVLGGGLGAQPSLAHIVHEFLHEDLIIPFSESVLRVFDRNGERNNRNKARLKFLVNKLGIDELMRLVVEEQTANKAKTFKINRETVAQPKASNAVFQTLEIPKEKQLAFDLWKATNVFEQKQKGFYGVYVKVQTGDMPTQQARKFITAIQDLVADEIRITINQGLLLKFVKPEALPNLFLALDELNLANAGFDSLADVTTCPGTDTCNLGISNSMELSRVLESVIYEEYPDFVKNKEIKRIILTRPAVEAGENLGFLPGDLKEKIDPYLRPLYDALDDMIPAEKLKQYLENRTIEVAPLAFMRGRTLDDAFVILDEAQNTTHSQMKMFLTRLGFGSKAVITGDMTQVDLPRHIGSGLVHATTVLADEPDIGITRFDSRDVVRHPLVERIVKAYDADAALLATPR